MSCNNQTATKQRTADLLAVFSRCFGRMAAAETSDFLGSELR